VRKLKSKTQKEIDAEIAALRELKPKIRRFSAFGNDHWKSIELQIAVLEQDMDNDDISGIIDPDENSIAYDTIQWREGRDVDYAPAETWKDLIRS
jgi:hypothetical protein